MSANGSLSSALSGLIVAQRRAAIVASNIANAATPGYGRRVLEVSARAVGSTGQGVMITGVTRVTDLRVIGERRLSQAEAGNRAVLADFYHAIEGQVGTPDEPQSLNGRIDAFNTALLDATSYPDSEARLNQVATTASALVNQIGMISASIQDQRAQADTEIANQVKRLNDALSRVADLNTQIRAHNGASEDPSALIDQRQQLIDSIADIVPIRQFERAGGEVALMTTGGMMLVDGRATRFEFAPVGVVTPEMTIESGALSGLSVNGRAIDVTGANSLVGGGSLAGLFQVRDVDAVRAQSQIDAVARDLVERYQDPALDATRTPGAPGLFTDGSGAFNPANEIGLAQRLRLNPAVDPEAGGQLWKLRDGLGATVPGYTGNASLLNDWETALTADRNPVSGGFMQGARSFSELSGDFTSKISSARLGAESDQTYAQSRADAMQSLELQGGVDTDQEMQDLVEIQQAYAANAKVLTAIDDMIKQLVDL
jgi:flagellar hook-associated protein 1 FlgK